MSTLTATNDQPIPLVPADSAILRTPATEVTNIDEQVVPHIYPMKATMRKHSGAGLAAPQVGVPFRFFLFEMNGCRLVINPKIFSKGGARVMRYEGCLSFPGRDAILVPRWEIILVEWQTSAGEKRTMRLRGKAAQVFQHQLDHLDGICIFPKDEPNPKPTD
jgi:peptide deformylase